MGTIFKILVIALAVVGLCVMMTHYIPSAWSNGWEIPVIKIHVSWAVTLLLTLIAFGAARFKIA